MCLLLDGFAVKDKYIFMNHIDWIVSLGSLEPSWDGLWIPVCFHMYQSYPATSRRYLLGVKLFALPLALNAIILRSSFEKPPK